MSLVRKVPCIEYRPEDTTYRRYAHYKLDGSFACLRKTPVSFGVYSSRGNNIAHKMQWHDRYKQWNGLPPGTSVLGELWVAGRPASYITTAIVERDPQLEFMPFAIDTYQGKNCYDDVGLLRMPLPEVYNILEGYGFPERIPHLDMVGLKTNAALHEALVAGKQPSYRGIKIEGYVYKNGNLCDFAKDKPEPTIDLIVSGYAYGDEDKANSDKVRRLICSTTEGYEVCVASGMTANASEYMTATKESLVGRVVEIRYQEVMTKGRLRHPRFLRFRDDKPATACVVDQSFDLKAYWAGKHQLNMFPEHLPE